MAANASRSCLACVSFSVFGYSSAMRGMPPSVTVLPMYCAAPSSEAIALRAAHLMADTERTPSKPKPVKCSMSSWSTP